MAALISSPLSLLFLFLVSGGSQQLKLPLLHRKPYPPSPSDALSADNRRLSLLFSPPRLPVRSGASLGSGQYLVSLQLGTPPQHLLLIADTGSDLTWVSCSACRGRCSPHSAPFHPRRSSTFTPHHCYDPACTLVPHPKACNHTRLHSPCRYHYSYADGSLTTGFFSTEAASFNTTSARLSFGCGFWNSGPSFNGGDGVLGLGRGPISFFSQLGRHFGHQFSYCLMDYTLSPPPTSYLLIGAAHSKFTYTPLLLNPLSPTFYYIKIDSVSINDVKLRISPSLWSIDDYGNGGTVVDSGTTITFLPEPAYRLILAVFDRLVKLPKSAKPVPGFDLCFNVSSPGSRETLPRLSFKLRGGAVFSPPPRNYFIDAAEGVMCLALQPVTTDAGFSVIGNLMQQGYTFEFDKDRSRLGFTRRGCSAPP